MSLVECISLDGRKIMVPQVRLVLRLAVYGIVVHDGKVLLMTLQHRGKYHPPGGGIGLGERMEDDAAGKPRWVNIQGLQARDFQAHGEVILDLCREERARQVRTASGDAS